MYSTIGFSMVGDLAAVEIFIDICAASDRFECRLHARLGRLAIFAKMRLAAEPCRQCTASKLDASVTAIGAVVMMLLPAVP